MLSVVIPTLNAEAFLADTLERMRAADEILIVDGGSLDRTRTIAQKAGRRLILAPKGRGAQLSAGAEAARGEWLLFLHADTLPGPRWREAADRHCARSADAACFRFRLNDPAWQARAIEQAVALRMSLFGLAYGDQGLLISRSLYDSVGGFRPLPLMEDVDLVRRIGRARLTLLDECAVTSAERWRRDGWARRSGRNLACLGLFAAGVRPERIARLYG